MTIDPTQLEMLAAFAEKLSENASEGERFEDIQRQREADEESARQALRDEIEAIEQKISAVRERARQAAKKENERYYRERERILNLTIPGMPERRQHQLRNQMLREHTHTYDDASRVFDWNMQEIYPLRRRQAQLQRQLDKM
jgi:hypothetical protein